MSSIIGRLATFLNLSRLWVQQVYSFVHDCASKISTGGALCCPEGWGYPLPHLPLPRDQVSSSTVQQVYVHGITLFVISIVLVLVCTASNLLLSRMRRFDAFLSF